MLITVNTFNAHNINDGTNYRATLLNPHGVTSAQPVFLPQADADSLDAGTFIVDVQNIVLTVKVLNQGSRHALIAQLKTWFKRGTQGSLVVTFNDEGVAYQKTCRVVNLVHEIETPQYFQVVLQSGASAWRAVSETTETTWVVTGTSETQAIVVGGKDETFLSASLTAVAGPAAGYLYQNLYRLPNTPGVTHGLIPWCITIDTAALVTAGKMQADCDDLRIVDMNTGREIRRWIAAPNTTATKVWINRNFGKGFSLTLSANVAGSGDVDYLQFAVTEDTKTKIAEMPRTGVVYHGNEWFSYISTDPVNCRLTVGQRGLFGTTIEAHSGAVTFSYIQYPLLLLYGNSSVSSPALTDATYDTYKPLFNLSSSSNTEWVWTASDKFFDPALPNRLGGWIFTRRALGSNSYVFYVKQNAESGDAAIGFRVAPILVGSVWKDENVELYASFRRAAGITSVSMTGDKFRSNVNWLPRVGLRRTSDFINYFDLWTEASPGSAAVWTAWTHSSVSVAAGTKLLQLTFSGGYPAVAGGYSAFEALTCTVVFDSSIIPTPAFIGEEDNYPLLVTLENLTTGDAINLDYMMVLTKTFVIDGELKTVKYDGVPVHSAVTLDDESRSNFLRLEGNATNTIQISGVDMGELHIVMRYYRRRL